VAAGDAFSRDQLLRIESARTTAEGQTGLRFPLYVGPVTGEPRAFGSGLLARLDHDDRGVVLVVVSPGQRCVEVVTSAVARSRLSDKACALAALSMTTSFGVGDLVGGLVSGLRMLAEACELPPGGHVRGAPPRA
jgi:Domain of unknown function (DUF5130)